MRKAMARNDALWKRAINVSLIFIKWSLVVLIQNIQHFVVVLGVQWGLLVNQLGGRRCASANRAWWTKARWVMNAIGFYYRVAIYCPLWLWRGSSRRTYLSCIDSVRTQTTEKEQKKKKTVGEEDEGKVSWSSAHFQVYLGTQPHSHPQSLIQNR